MTIPLAVGVAVVAVTAVLAAQALLRSRVPEDGLWGRPEPNHSGSVMAVMGGVFAILVAFVMFLAFQNFVTAKRSADTEAVAVERQFHEAGALHPALRRHVYGDLVCYSRAVIEDEWPKLEEGDHSELVDDWGLESESTFRLARLSDPAEAEASRQINEIEQDREEARRDRITAADGFVPALLWVALITGGTLLILYILSFVNPGIRRGLQMLQLAAVTTVAALNLCVVAFLDTPFSGAAGSVGPTAMERTLEELDRELELQPTPVAIPCDESGRPEAGHAGPIRNMGPAPR